MGDAEFPLGGDRVVIMVRGESGRERKMRGVYIAFNFC
jgi:hypothetical protein